MKRSIALLVGAFLGASSIAQATTLSVPLVVQEQDNWCWAGSSRCILLYFGVDVPQCKIAEFTRNVATWNNFGPIDCCVDPSQGCNHSNYNFGHAGSVEEILERWGLGTGISGKLSLAQAQGEIDANHPFMISWVWDSSGGHVVVGHGVTGNVMSYMDPWPGEGFKTGTHAWVTVGGGHTWTGTNLITTPPLCASSPNGTPCDDGDACTPGDACLAGVCKGGTPTLCPTPDSCHKPGTCNLVTGACSNPARPDGTACSDQNACTLSDTCHTGACLGIETTCDALDDCHDPGVCNPSTGECSNPIKPNGAVCNDGNGCTQGDSCDEGTCVPGPSVVCGAPDSCHQPGGVCDPGTGTCNFPLKPSGSACNDNDACTEIDACQGGVCIGTHPVACPPPNGCQQPGACQSATGQCVYPTMPDGTTCSDSNACTQSDTCQAGQCVGGQPVVCPALDSCHEPGACDASTGLCVNPAKPDGTSCDDGNGCSLGDTCQSGLCLAGTPVVCAALDSCHEPGVCDSATGICSQPAKPDGTGCSDGNACTQQDSCASGTCVAGAPLNCAGPDECHDPGSCDPTSGACAYPAKPEGTTCSLGSCQAGICTAPSDGGTDALPADAAMDALEESTTDAAVDSNVDGPMEAGKDGAQEGSSEGGADGAQDTAFDSKEASFDATHEGTISDTRREAVSSDSGGSSAEAPGPNDSGCGCEVVGTPGRMAPWLAIGALGLLMIGRRSSPRRRRFPEV